MKDMNTINELAEGIKSWLKAGKAETRQCICLMIDKESKGHVQLMQGDATYLAVMLAAAAINDEDFGDIIEHANFMLHLCE